MKNDGYPEVRYPHGFKLQSKDGILLARVRTAIAGGRNLYIVPRRLQLLYLGSCLLLELLVVVFVLYMNMNMNASGDEWRVCGLLFNLLIMLGLDIDFQPLDSEIFLEQFCDKKRQNLGPKNINRKALSCFEILM